MLGFAGGLLLNFLRIHDDPCLILTSHQRAKNCNTQGLPSTLTMYWPASKHSLNSKENLLDWASTLDEDKVDWGEDERKQVKAFLLDDSTVTAFLETLLRRYKSSDAIYCRQV